MSQAILNLTVTIFFPLSDQHSSYKKDLQEMKNLKEWGGGRGEGEEKMMLVLYEIRSFRNRRTPKEIKHKQRKTEAMSLKVF